MLAVTILCSSQSYNSFVSTTRMYWKESPFIAIFMLILLGSSFKIAQKEGQCSTLLVPIVERRLSMTVGAISVKIAISVMRRQNQPTILVSKCKTAVDN